jgi:BirA family biotin operon repressor/biotin-[acetyl-CoA-carboxylase] ligase
MADAAETAGGLAVGTVRLKWPNDLVVESPDGVRKLAGVLGESDGIGSHDPRAVIGIGVNGDWAPTDFPTDLAGSMTSLREVTGRPIDHAALLDAFLGRLEVTVDALREGRFDASGWSERQVTTGRDVDLIAPDGTTSTVRATGVDADTGALLVENRPVLVGEVRHVRLADPAAV